MKEVIKKALNGPLGKAFDFLVSLGIYPAALLLKLVRAIGVQRLPQSKKALFNVGLFPIAAHYYEPIFGLTTEQHTKISNKRSLPGIDWNLDEQITLLQTMQFATSLNQLPYKKTDPLLFHLNNGSFESGDAEYWYQIIRVKKPKRIFEIGSGNSTLMARQAIRDIKAEDPSYQCKHICIEPYEMPWLEKTGAEIMRNKVEDLEVSFFSELKQDDILFIDSSHMIRPGGDVLFEYLEILPTLAPGVIVHIHDIFSPHDYLKEWLVDKVLFWNEQYLLEAFLCNNSEWKIIGALNFLHHSYYDKLKEVSPYLTKDREPGSFYLQKRGAPTIQIHDDL